MLVTQGERAVVSPGPTWITPLKTKEKKKKEEKKTFRKIIITGETFAIFNLLGFFVLELI